MSVTGCGNSRHYGVLCIYHEHELPKVPKLLDKEYYSNLGVFPSCIETMIGEYCDSDTYSTLVVYNPMIYTHKILIERRKQFRKELVFFRFQQEYERLEERIILNAQLFTGDIKIRHELHQFSKRIWKLYHQVANSERKFVIKSDLHQFVSNSLSKTSNRTIFVK